MARLFTSTISGATTAASAGFTTTGTAPTIATAPTGGDSVLIPYANTTATRLIRHSIAMPTGVDYYAEIPIVIDGTPTAGMDICSFSSGSTQLKLRLQTSRIMNLQDSVSTVLAATTALNINQLYTFEVYWRVQTSTTGLWELRLDGVTVASGRTGNFGSSAGTEFISGKNTATNSGINVYVCPEVAVNDGTGLTSNTWVGFGGSSSQDLGSLTAAGTSAATVALAAKPTLLLDPVGGSSTTSLAVRAGSGPQLLLQSNAVSSNSLALTARNLLQLSRPAGIGSATFSFQVGRSVALNPITGTSSATLTVIGRPTILLDAVGALSTAAAGLSIPPAPASRRAVIVAREIPPLWLAVIATPPGSRASTRWGGDEASYLDVPSGIQLSSSVPGGFDTASMTLPRHAAHGYSDLERLADIRIHGAGGRIAWEGRLNEAPAVSGGGDSISPSAVGYKSHLEDNSSASLIIMDRDLSRWTGPGAQRKLNLINSSVPQQTDPTVDWDDANNTPAITLMIQGAWGAGVTPRVEAWYDAGSNNVISEIRSDWSGWPDANFQLYAVVSTDAVDSSQEQSVDFYTAANGSFDFRPANRWRFGWVRWHYFSSPAGGDGSSYSVKLFNLFVLGDHGLTQQTGPDGYKGYYCSDIVRYIVGKWAPLLNRTSTSISPTTYAIPQAAFYDGTTVSAMLDEITRYGLEDWGVWDNKTFYLYPRGTFGRRWRARVGEARLKETGPTTERLWNGVTVKYRDVDGTTRTVGPPGSGADDTDSALQDTDPNNSANKAGITRYAPPLEMGIPSTAGAAVHVGSRFLQETKALDRSGSAELQGVVEDDKGRLHPAWAVRGGDQIQFMDASDTGWRRIVRAVYNEGALTSSVDLDAPPGGIPAILARLGLAVAGVG